MGGRWFDGRGRRARVRSAASGQPNRPWVGPERGSRRAGRYRDSFRVATMIQFEDLPRTHRTLLVATIELEIAEAKCTNILELAHKRNLPIQDLWRDVCRRTGQPRCTVPAAVMVSRDQWLGAATSRHADAAPAPAAVESSPSASAKDSPPPASVQDGGATADTIAATAVPAKQL